MTMDEPVMPLAETAAVAHETFRAYVDAGFDEQQALYLVGCLVSVTHRHYLDVEAVQEKAAAIGEQYRRLLNEGVIRIRPEPMEGDPAIYDPADAIARCAVCDGPLTDDGTRLVCPDHPPDERPSRRPPGSWHPFGWTGR